MQFVSSKKNINISYHRSNCIDESFVDSRLFTQICCVIHVSKLLKMCMLIPGIGDYLDKNVLLNFEGLNEHCLPPTPYLSTRGQEFSKFNMEIQQSTASIRTMNRSSWCAFSWQVRTLLVSLSRPSYSFIHNGKQMKHEATRLTEAQRCKIIAKLSKLNELSKPNESSKRELGREQWDNQKKQLQ